MRNLLSAVLALVLMVLIGSAVAMAGDRMHAGDRLYLKSGNMGFATGCITFKALASKTVVTGQIAAGTPPPGPPPPNFSKTITVHKGAHVSADYFGGNLLIVDEGSIEILGNRKKGGGCPNALGLR